MDLSLEERIYQKIISGKNGLLPLAVIPGGFILQARHQIRKNSRHPDYKLFNYLAYGSLEAAKLVFYGGIGLGVYAIMRAVS